jgi:hypothetical protein
MSLKQYGVPTEFVVTGIPSSGEVIPLINGEVFLSAT